MAEILDIVLRERGGDQVARSMERIAGRAGAVAAEVRILRRALNALGVVLTSRALITASDAYTNLQNRIRVVTSSQGQLAEVTDELFKVSRDTRSSFTATAEIYSRTALAARDLGTTQREIISVTRSLNQAVVLSGAGAREAENAMIQLSQGIASGTLRGDELRSVLEQLPVVADVIADHLGVTRGQLRALGREGKLTSKVIIDAFLEASDSLESRFAETVPTLSQSFIVLRNAFVRVVGELSTSTGFAQVLGAALRFLADNMDTVARAVISLASTIGVLLVRRALVGLFARLNTLSLLLQTHPLLALATFIVAAVTALGAFADKIQITSNGVATLADLFGVLLEHAVAALRAVGRFISEGVTAASAALGDLLGVTQLSFQEALYFIAVFIDKAVSGFELVGAALKAVFIGIPLFVAGATIQLVNFVLSGIETVINETLSALNELFKNPAVAGFLGGVTGVPLAALNPNRLRRVELGRAGGGDELEQRALQMGYEVENAQDRFLGSALGAVGQRIITGIDSIFADAEKRAEQRLARRQSELDVRGRLAPPPPDPDEARRRARLLDELNRLRASLNPIVAAQIKLAETATLLRKAEAAGLVTRRESNALLLAQEEALKAQLNPMRAWILEQERENDLLRLTARQREHEVRTRQASDQLRDRGVKIGEVELQQIRSAVAVRIHLEELDKERTAELERQKAQLEAIRGPVRDYQLQLRSLTQVYREGKISAEEFSRQADQLERSVLAARIDEDAGLRRGLLAIKADVQDVASVMENTLVNAFRSAEDALVRFVLTGSFEFSKLVDSILADVTRLLARQALLGLFGGSGLISLGPSPIPPLPGFANGGQFRVGGSGGTDSQVVAFRATPGEQVTISPQGQAAQAAPAPQIRVINVISPEEALSALGSPAGEQVVLNVIGRNPEKVKRLLR